VQPSPMQGREPAPYDPTIYRDISRVMINNFIYIGNLHALRAWYRHVRQSVMGNDVFREFCLKGALSRLEEALAERVKRVGEMASKMSHSVDRLRANPSGSISEQWIRQQQGFADRWPDLERQLLDRQMEDAPNHHAETFAQIWSDLGEKNGYLKTIHALPAEARMVGSQWLQGIVDYYSGLWKPV
ncbi:MAG: hypothetical protein V2A34_00575, partial [Lentisphaerota bacterium]